MPLRIRNFFLPAESGPKLAAERPNPPHAPFFPILQDREDERPGATPFRPAAAGSVSNRDRP